MRVLKKILLVIVIFSICIIVFLLFRNINMKKVQKDKDNEIISKMENLIPKESLGELEIGEGKPTLEIDSKSYVGMLNIDSLKLKFPVQSIRDLSNDFALYLDDTTTDTKTVIVCEADYGRKKELMKLKEYDEISFITIRGNEYQYTITSITNIDEKIDDSEENLIIKIKDGNFCITIRGVLK